MNEPIWPRIVGPIALAIVMAGAFALWLPLGLALLGLYTVAVFTLGRAKCARCGHNLNIHSAIGPCWKCHCLAYKAA